MYIRHCSIYVGWVKDCSLGETQGTREQGFRIAPGCHRNRKIRTLDRAQSNRDARALIAWVAPRLQTIFWMSIATTSIASTRPASSRPAKSTRPRSPMTSTASIRLDRINTPSTASSRSWAGIEPHGQFRQYILYTGRAYEQSCRRIADPSRGLDQGSPSDPGHCCGGDCRLRRGPGVTVRGEAAASSRAHESISRLELSRPRLLSTVLRPRARPENPNAGSKYRSTCELQVSPSLVPGLISSGTAQ